MEKPLRMGHHSTMFARSSKRVYSPSALDCWLERLDCDWERWFSAAALSTGRTLYRKGDIRAIELSDDNAIIEGRFNGEDCYAVVEWPGNRPTVRASKGDPLIQGALAVAGLYEIEELVCDEAHEFALGKPAAAETPIGLPLAAEKPPCAPQTPATAEARPPRELHLKFDLEATRLRLKAFWNPILSQANLTRQEREKLVLLTSQARKAGFETAGEMEFTLDDLDSLPLLASETLPRWRKRFVVSGDDSFGLCERGVDEAEIAVGLDCLEDGLECQVSFRYRGGSLSAAERELLAKAEGRSVFLKNRGLVRVNRQQSEGLSALQEALSVAGNGKIPAYMLLSIMGDARLQTSLSESLKVWLQGLDEPAADIGSLPTGIRDYQRKGTEWMWNLAERGCHGLLADEMGLGKTLQALCLLQKCIRTGYPALVVCPASVIPVWLLETERFFPDLRIALLGRSTVLSETAADLWIASYTQLRRHKSKLQDVDFSLAVLDEAHFIKNPTTKVTQACLSIRARSRFALTGTPIENSERDLWTLFRFLMPGLLGTRGHLDQQLREAPEELRERLRRQTAPFILRRTKEAVLSELPKKLETVLSCPMLDLQRAEYQRLCEEGITQLDNRLEYTEQRQRMGLLALLTRLRQVSCAPGLVPGVRAGWEQSGKLAVLVDRVSEALSTGHSVVLFSQFVQFLELARTGIQATCPGVPLYTLTGKTKDRAEPVAAFQRSPVPAVFLASLRAAGTGITLHSADYVFLLDPWWNPAVEQQAIDRVHRMGQSHTVFVYRMISRGTIEDRVEKLKSGKTVISRDILMGQDESWRPSEHFSSLRELIMLRN